VKLGEDQVASNKLIDEHESNLLNRLISTYRCITDDDDFKACLSDTKVSISAALAKTAKCTEYSRKQANYRKFS